MGQEVLRVAQLLEHGGAHDARLEGGGSHGRRHGDGLFSREEWRWGGRRSVGQAQAGGMRTPRGRVLGEGWRSRPAVVDGAGRRRRRKRKRRRNETREGTAGRKKGTRLKYFEEPWRNGSMLHHHLHSGLKTCSPCEGQVGSQGRREPPAGASATPPSSVTGPARAIATPSSLQFRANSPQSTPISLRQATRRGQASASLLPPYCVWSAAERMARRRRRSMGVESAMR